MKAGAYVVGGCSMKMVVAVVVVSLLVVVVGLSYTTGGCSVAKDGAQVDGGCSLGTSYPDGGCCFGAMYEFGGGAPQSESNLGEGADTMTTS